MATAVSSPIRATTAALTGALHPIANEPEHCEQSTPLVLVHHSLITADSDALQFHAAASLQLQPNRKHASNAKTDDKLISSPYNDYFHLLDLKSLDTPSQLLAKALTIFKPICTNYATAPYIESFNWEAIFAFLRELSTTEGFSWPTKQSFYVVVFRSILSVDANKDRLSELDYHSHREATSSGGLLKYWFGSTNENRENLATCIWRNKGDARLGGAGPWHRQARAAAKDMYESFTFTSLRLDIEDGVSSWSFREWVDDK